MGSPGPRPGLQSLRRNYRSVGAMTSVVQVDTYPEDDVVTLMAVGGPVSVVTDLNADRVAALVGQLTTWLARRAGQGA